MRSGRRPLATLVSILLLGGLFPGALSVAKAAPNPIAQDPASYLAFGRVFSDPQGCQAYGIPDTDGDGVKDTDQGVSPWAKGRMCANQFLSYQEVIDGAHLLHDLFPDYVQVIKLDEAYDNANFKSAGIPRTITVDDGGPKVLSRDRRPLYMFKVTDATSTIEEKDRKHFAFSLSIHGPERAGLEGGIRAMEDLVTWAACENELDVDLAGQSLDIPACTDEGPFPKKIVETPTNHEVPTAAQVLRESVLYFTLPNPDGWARGQTAPVELEDGSPNVNYLPGFAFQRFNGNGVDLNRDWPTLGYTWKPFSPGSEPETKAFAHALSGIRSTTAEDRFTGGLDLHGMTTASAFSYTLLGAGQRDYRKNAVTVDTSIRTWEDQTKRLAWSPWIVDSNNDGLRDSPTCTRDPAFGGCVPAPVADMWGTVIDTLGYQITGGFGDWFDSPLGLNAVGVDNEMYVSHLAPNSIFEPALEQTHIDGNKGLIYSQIAALLTEEPATFETEGNKVGYVYNPNRLQVAAQDRPETLGYPAQNDIDVVVPCVNEATPMGVDGGCEGATFTPGTAPNLEFTVEGPDTGHWNGGLTVTATFANANGHNPGGLGSITLQYFDEGNWNNVATSVQSEATFYSQAGRIVTVNDPEPGQWRITFPAASPFPARVNIDYNHVEAETSPGQAAIDASPMDFFSDLNRYAGEGSALSPIEVPAIVANPDLLRQFDTVILVNDLGARSHLVEKMGLSDDQASAFFSGLKNFVETGGNLILTDGALRALPEITTLPQSAVIRNTGNTAVSPVGSFNFLIDGAKTYIDALRFPLSEGVNLPGAAEEEANGRRQVAEPAPLGFSPHTADGTPMMPHWGVERAAWEAACGKAQKADCTTALATRMTSQAPIQTNLGEMDLGQGHIRIAGVLLPDPVYAPDNNNDMRFGLASYALTYTAYIVFENLVEWANPGRIEPDTRQPVTLSFTEASARDGYHTDQATVEVSLLDTAGTPLVNAPLTLELSDATGALISQQAATDSAGLARFTLDLTQPPGEYGLVVDFAGSDGYLPAEATDSFLIRKELTAMTVTVTGNGKNRVITAVLTEDDSPAVAEKLVQFYADGNLIGEATTDATGTARLPAPPDYRGGAHLYEARFEGDTLFEESAGNFQTTG